MKRIELTFIVISLLTGIFQTRGQEFTPEFPITDEQKGLYAGAMASTNGPGLSLGYILSPGITLRGGVETLKFGYDFSFEENDMSYDANLDYKTGAVFLVADLFFTSRLCFSGGFALNSFNPRVVGQAGSDLEYGDISIPASKVGDFAIAVEPSMKVSPYAGAGFRHFFGKNKRVYYNFETGVYYMGAPQFDIMASGLLAPTADPAHGKKEYLENQFNAYKIYPLVKLHIGIKLL